jgi:hypothetical protein
MPYIGLGLHVLVALFFAVHAVRNGRELYWLMILFMAPMLGSIVYFFAVYMPETRLEQGMRKTMTAAARSLNPGGEMREAAKAFELLPTAQNQMILANACLNAGDTAQAIAHFEACLQGPFASDAEVRLGAANAYLLQGNGNAAISLLEAVRKDQPTYRVEHTSLSLAQAYAMAGRQQDAGVEYASAVARFGSMEAKAEYAIWALQAGEHGTANTQYAEIQSNMKHWNKHTRMLNKALIKRLETAFAGRV